MQETQFYCCVVQTTQKTLVTWQLSIVGMWRCCTYAEVRLPSRCLEAGCITLLFHCWLCVLLFLWLSHSCIEQTCHNIVMAPAAASLASKLNLWVKTDDSFTMDGKIVICLAHKRRIACSMKSQSEQHIQSMLHTKNKQLSSSKKSS
jgi:hypothetical protein